MSDDGRAAKRQRFSPSELEYVAPDDADADGHQARPSSSSRRPTSVAASLEPCLLNAEPFDEVMRHVADWIYRTARDYSNVEVEAKIGLLIDTSTGQRVSFPVLTETILDPSYDRVRFESNMSQAQHQHFNAMLNKLHATYKQPGYTGAQIDYQHVRVIDSFYPTGGPGREKLRVSRDPTTNKTVESIIKRRIGDLNILCPSMNADWRVSVNVEDPVPEPPTGAKEDHQRNKDRISYTHQAFRIDLTQVKDSGSQGKQPPTHELEIEFAQGDELMRFASVRGDLSSPECDTFDELVRVFVNNCRLMIRNVVSRWD
ncbi:mRNA triphosphatase CET1 [Exidia glandulosa HHB12029]|uniref:mRNA-capping enzyme subunit beta n=1 Tax=Exidia glandulosa HHB12029 TaxID=1314781 RepID=A0A165EZL9_EXIGL|nr:mRNA triphosphatase CET1 [Exidia glandulosa HHB12029]